MSDPRKAVITAIKASLNASPSRDAAANRFLRDHMDSGLITETDYLNCFNGRERERLEAAEDEREEV